MPGFVGAILALVLFAAPARAHEFWIDPAAALPATGGQIRTNFRVGQNFVGDPYPYLSSRSNFLRVFVRGKTSGIPGNEGDMPAVAIDAPDPGLNVIAYYGKPTLVTFEDPAIFATYLESEGLNWVAAAHSARGLPPSGFTEAFSRTVKSLVQVGPITPADKDVETGLPFEMVAEENPYGLAAGSGSLPVRLLWQGKPAADTQIAIFQDRGSVVRSVLRTDPEGRAIIPITGGGRFLLNAVHVREALPTLDAAWESHWASLTFELPRE